MPAPSTFGVKASAAVAAWHIVAHGASIGLCVQATAGTALLLGVSDNLPKADGEMVDIQAEPIGEVTFGATVAAGDKLTSDSQGRAIKAVPTSGQTLFVIGLAYEAGTVGQVKRYLRAPGSVTG